MTSGVPFYFAFETGSHYVIQAGPWIHYVPYLASSMW